MVAIMDDIVEWSTPADRYRDYCMWDYEPLMPVAGKLRQSSLLWHSFATLGAPPNLRRIVESLRAELGAFETVWGVKRIGERFSWELYIYDYGRLERRASIARVLKAIAPWAPSTLSLAEDRPYFMFSLDLDVDLGQGQRQIDELSVYIGNPGSSVSSGICYQLTADGLRLDNMYYFFDAHEQWDEIVAKVACSAHLGLRGLDIDSILWPELRDCGVIVVANKKFNDGVYFSRVTIDKLMFFLDRMNYPHAVQAFLRDNRYRLDHLLYDVGIDYSRVDGRTEIIKSAYYGVV